MARDYKGISFSPDDESRLVNVIVKLDNQGFGKWDAAVRHWESLTRPAPVPGEQNKNGRLRLTAKFDEWLMGLSEGWVTDVDMPYGEMIKMCGNGAVPQQAEFALRYLLAS